MPGNRHAAGYVLGRNPQGKVDDLVEAERHAAGVGPLGLLIAYGRTCLAEACLTVPVIQPFPLGSQLVEQGLRGAVQQGPDVGQLPVPSDERRQLGREIVGQRPSRRREHPR